MKPVEPNDPRSPSVQIADDIRAQIEGDELPLGTRLPSTRELARQYGVALMTVQTALGRLRDERRVYATGRGYFVGESESPANGEDQRDELTTRLQEVEAEVRNLRKRIETLEAGE
jgi:DNA-binding GntR family transcriptional regulator